MAGVTVMALTSVMIDPIDGSVTSAIPFEVTDPAGQKAAAVVNVPFAGPEIATVPTLQEYALLLLMLLMLGTGLLAVRRR